MNENFSRNQMESSFTWDNPEMEDLDIKAKIKSVSDELFGKIENLQAIVADIKGSGREDTFNTAVENKDLLATQLAEKARKTLEGCVPILLALSKPATTLVRRITKLLEQPQLPDLQTRGFAPYVLGTLTLMAIVEAIRPVSEFIQSQNSNKNI